MVSTSGVKNAINRLTHDRVIAAVSTKGNCQIPPSNEDRVQSLHRQDVGNVVEGGWVFNHGDDRNAGIGSVDLSPHRIGAISSRTRDTGKAALSFAIATSRHQCARILDCRYMRREDARGTAVQRCGNRVRAQLRHPYHAVNPASAASQQTQVHGGAVEHAVLLVDHHKVKTDATEDFHRTRIADLHEAAVHDVVSIDPFTQAGDAG